MILATRYRLAPAAMLLLPALLAIGCTNPFAPKLEPALQPSLTTLGDQRTVSGVFQNIQYAYTYRDTLIYGQLLHPDFQFRYYNPDRATDVTFNRDEEVRTTYNLFKGADQIDLQWNEYVTQDGDSLLTDVSRSYTLTIALQANDLFRIEGRATLRLVRNSPNDVWLIKSWRDDSSF
ncbi:MAG: hypothetical protein JST22_15450 [Bacteroidetes bacterium]|nr:hypothetical protein [Bacteroidota bacterium]